jgi:hypothetical protein
MSAQASEKDKPSKTRTAADEHAALVPTVRLATVHPFRVGELVSHISEELYYFFPAGCPWSTSALCFGQTVGGSMRNSVFYSENMIAQVFLLAKTLGEDEFEGRVAQTVTWTVVPHKENEKETAGFLVRMSYQVPPGEVNSQPTTMIKRQVMACEAFYNSQVWKVRQRYVEPKHRPPHQRMEENDWMQMCQFYLGKAISPRHEIDEAFDDPDNRWAPLNVFSLNNALKLMGNFGAAVDFLEPSNYRTGSRAVFPRDGACTWWMPPLEMNCANMSKILLPHAPDNATIYETDDFRSFLKH